MTILDKGRRSMICALTLPVILYVGPSYGQSGGSLKAPSAEKMLISAGSVDLRTGRYIYNDTDLQMASDADGGLSLSRTTSTAVGGHIDPLGSFASNWDIFLTEKRIDIEKRKYINGAGDDYQISVRYGSRSDTFEGRFVSNGFEQTSKGDFAGLSYAGDRNGGVAYTYTTIDNVRIDFRALGNECSSLFRCAYASRVTRPDGVVFDLEYETFSPGVANGVRLRSVRSSRGYVLIFEYGITPNLVAKACVVNLAYATFPAGSVCPVGSQAASYQYVSFDRTRLATATKPDQSITTFGYSYRDGGVEMAFTLPGQASPWLRNLLFVGTSEDQAQDDVVGRQDFADGRSYIYEFRESPYTVTEDGETQPPKRIAEGYTDQAGRRVSVQYAFPILPQSTTADEFPTVGHINYQMTPDPIMITDQIGRVTRQDFCDPVAAAAYDPREQNRCLVTLLQSITEPDGAKTYLVYDGFRHVTLVRKVAKPGSGLPDIVTQALYGCVFPQSSCNKPLTVTDARLNVTEYSYDPAHGGVLRETSPANDAGIRAVKRYSYVQRYAWLASGTRGYVRATTPVWLLNDERTCRTTATQGDSCAGGAADEVVTSYDYGPDAGPNTLLLRGVVVTADGASRRTCYGYDRQGNRISETKPRAGLNACPAN